MKLSKKIIDIRNNSNLTQEEFAEKLSVSRQTVSNWENDKCYPDIETLIIISDMFNISLDNLLKDDKEMVKKIDKKVKSNKYNKMIIIFLSILLTFIVIVLIVLIIFNESSFEKIDNNDVDKISDENILSCIIDEVSGYVANEKNILKEISLNTFTSYENKVDFYNASITDDGNIYAIVKTSDYEVVREFDEYFSNKYDIYQTYVIGDNIYIYVYNKKNDIDFDGLNKCSVINSELNEVDIKNMNSKVVEKLNKTDRIVVKAGDNELGIIEEQEVITEILNIIAGSKRYGDSFLTDGHQFEFEMYNKDGDLLDTIYIWRDGARLIPKSIQGGYYNASNNDVRKIIESETDYIFYNLFSVSDSCEELELIYEDEKYNYYFNCKEFGKMLIKFDLTNMKMNIKYALENNYINIEQLSLYKEMILTEEKSK